MKSVNEKEYFCHMIKRFLDFLSRNDLNMDGQFTFLAVSGGLDSVVMADLYNRAGLSFGILHCNFHLRGEESNDDQRFVSDLATKYDVPFLVEEFDTSNYSETKGVSIQVAARELRYDWFDKIISEASDRKIATVDRQGQTGTCRDAIAQHGTCTAHTLVASAFRAG